jgi:hypothetical protein
MVALGIMTDFEDNFTDNLSAQLTRKKSVDESIQTMLSNLRASADAATSSAYADVTTAAGVLKKASDELDYWGGVYSRALTALSDAKTAANQARTVQASGSRNELTLVHLITDGSTSVSTIYYNLNSGISAQTLASYWASPILSLSTTDFLNQCYAAAFNRAPDAAGFQFWSNAINSGASDKATAAYKIFTSSESYDLHASALSSALSAQNTEITRRLDSEGSAQRWADGAAASYSGASTAYGTANSQLSAANAVYNQAARVSATYAAMMTANSAVINADAVSASYATATDKYLAAKEAIRWAGVLLDDLKPKQTAYKAALTADTSARAQADAEASAATAWWPTTPRRRRSSKPARWPSCSSP